MGPAINPFWPRASGACDSVSGTGIVSTLVVDQAGDGIRALPCRLEQAVPVPQRDERQEQSERCEKPSPDCIHARAPFVDHAMRLAKPFTASKPKAKQVARQQVVKFYEGCSLSENPLRHDHGHERVAPGTGLGAPAERLNRSTLTRVLHETRDAVHCSARRPFLRRSRRRDPHRRIRIVAPGQSERRFGFLHKPRPVASVAPSQKAFNVPSFGRFARHAALPGR
jgi:hypothetical protein